MKQEAKTLILGSGLGVSLERWMMSDFPGSLPEDQLSRIDHLADRFEHELKQGEQPQIEALLEAHPDLRAPLLKQLLRLELAYRRQAGQEPHAEEYKQRFADDWYAIAPLFDEISLSTTLRAGQHVPRFPGKESLVLKANASANAGEPGPTTETGLPSSANLEELDATAIFCVETSPGNFLHYQHAHQQAELQAIFKKGELIQKRYVVHGELGRGGMGQVYLAHDETLNRHVAVKVSLLLNEGRAKRQDALLKIREAFYEEARMGAQLIHSAIATIYDYGFHYGVPFAVYEYLSGPTLSEAISSNSPMPIEDVRMIIAPLAQALDYAHENHVLHRDLKPANVRADHHGNFKILDLGLAKEFKESDEWHRYAGTPAYSSPEQAAGRPCDGRSDQYALALLAFEMLVGRRLFTAQSAKRMLEMHRSASVTITAGCVPESVAEALTMALSKDPNERFRTCQEFAQALGARFVQTVPSQAGTAYATIALKAFAGLCLPNIMGPLPQPHIMSPAIMFSAGELWFAYLVIDEQSLWICFRGEVRRYPLDRITKTKKLLRRYLLRIWLQEEGDGKAHLTLHFSSKRECLRTRDALHCAMHSTSEPSKLSTGRITAIPILSERPRVSFQVLGLIEATHSNKWVAEASLRVQAVKMGADAVIQVTHEKLPGMRATRQHLQGTAVQIVDPQGRRAIWERWFSTENARLQRWSIGVAVMLLLLLWFPNSITHLRELVSSWDELLALSLCILFVESSHICSTIALRVTRWPQLSRATNIAFLTSTLPYLIFAWNPVVLASVLVKAFLAHRAMEIHSRFCEALAPPEGPTNARRVLVIVLVIAWAFIVAASSCLVLALAFLLPE